jgi:selenocysteine-specific elongation factor
MTDQSRHFILGAAGHVDHGKTALVTALTGTNTDRLKEEQERGISIELGFAELDLGDGVHLGVVDMPGHEKFVKQMVSGAGGVDLAFLVIAADEGVMPQTIEHLEILDALRVRSGLVVVTKTDMVDEDFVGVVTEEAADLVAGTFLEGRPIIAVSAHKGTGLDELRAALKAEALALPRRAEQGLFRLPVDRVFTMPGAGVVVTGTCWSGAVGEGDKLLVEPGSLPVRVREVQVHGRAAPRGASGQRLALALHGVKRDDMERGQQVVAPRAAAATKRLDIRLDLMKHCRRAIKNRQRLHVHHAGREVLARIVLLDVQELGGETAAKAGGVRTALAQLHLEDELVAAYGDRLVLRFYSPLVSVAGGVVLDAAPALHKRFDDEVLAQLAVLETGSPEELFLKKLADAGTAGLPPEAAGIWADHPLLQAVGARIYHRNVLAQLAAAVGEQVQDHARRFPLRLGISKEEARRRCEFAGGANEWNAVCSALAAPGSWVVVGDRIAASPEGPKLNVRLQNAVDQAVAELDALGLEWPGLDHWAAGSPNFQRAAADAALKDFKPAEVARWLVDHGRAVPIAGDYLVAAGARAALVAKLRAHFAREPELTFSGFRELSGLTRKLGIPMLEYLDQSGVTERDGDLRRAGPALADGQT